MKNTALIEEQDEVMVIECEYDSFLEGSIGIASVIKGDRVTVRHDSVNGSTYVDHYMSDLKLITKASQRTKFVTEWSPNTPNEYSFLIMLGWTVVKEQYGFHMIGKDPVEVQCGDKGRFTRNYIVDKRFDNSKSYMKYGYPELFS